jgi:MoaA/NifB/PqqE/SkfB family radical SAM enzyme
MINANQPCKKELLEISMNHKPFTQFAQDQGLSALLNMVEHASDRDIDLLFSTMIHFTRDNQLAQRQLKSIQQSWREDFPTTRLIKRGLHELNPRVKKALVSNLVLNNSYGPAAAERSRLVKEEHFRPPYILLISPTMRCNLHCVGCYAGEYSQQDDLPYETIDRIISEANAMGIYAITILGGEPFVRKDMWDIYKKYSGTEFVVFTNGTPLNEENVRRISELGNIAPMISIEGFRADTDARRGEGTYDAILKAMDLLHQAGVLFGFSSMVTRHNVEDLCSDAFLDLMISKGAYIGWHFLYMPIGRNPEPELMPTPEQREYLRTHGASRIRSTRPLFMIDFWNDAPYVGGCIAGGKEYLHINSRGDVEPCIFTHFATDNIKDKSLREVCESPFFRAIQNRQPYNPNLLLPCQLIDNPQVFREIYAQYKPYPTHEGAESLIQELAPTLDHYSACIQATMAPAWEKDARNKQAVKEEEKEAIPA